MRFLRLYIFLFRPSTFQQRQVKVLDRCKEVIDSVSGEVSKAVSDVLDVGGKGSGESLQGIVKYVCTFGEDVAQTEVVGFSRLISLG